MVKESARAVLGLTGKRYCGKSEVALWLARSHGFELLDFTADVLGPELRKQGKLVTRQNLIELATALRKKWGADILARRLAQKATKDKIAISGIRFAQEVRYFRQRFGKAFRLIAITSPAKVRWARAARVAKGETKLSFGQFLAIDQAVTEKHIPELIKMADFTISNNSTKRALHKKIDRLVRFLLQS